MADPCITFLSDFGTSDGYVGAVKGVILSLCPTARIVDLAHDIEPGNIVAGALALMTATQTFRPGTIHLAVVDPGVGTARNALLVESGGRCFIGPDNGLLSLAAPAPRQISKLDRPQYFREHVSPTFHGRDVFAPIAARLASGLAADRLGSPIDEMIELDIGAASHAAGGVTGRILHADRFGNLVTTIRDEDLPEDRARLRVSFDGAPSMRIVTTYGSAARGTLVALVGSSGFLEIAVVGGSAREKLGAAGASGCEVLVAPESS